MLFSRTRGIREPDSFGFESEHEVISPLPLLPQSTRVISFQFSGVSSHHKLNWAAKSQGNRNGKGVGRRGRPSFGAYFKSRFCGLEAQALYQGAVCGDNNDSDEADESQDSEDGDENNDDDADADSVWP